MATITITIPDAQLARVLDALARAYGWKTGDGPKPAFVRAAVAAQLKTMVVQVERGEAERSAVAAVPAPVDPGIS